MATILIADDDSITRNLLELNLQDEGHQVTGVSNGEEALEKLLTEQPDLIIADVMMPHVDGYALCKACKNKPALHHIPIILYSRCDTREHEQQSGYAFGADRYLIKPIDPQLLSTTIAQLLTRPDTIEPTEISLDEEMQRLKTYNEVLFNKRSKKMQELEQLSNKRKLEFASGDIVTLVDESIDGIDRLKSIITNLKSFCRKDQLEKTEIDINDLLKSIVNIARNELKHIATVQLDLQKLPSFLCFPQQLGQVFLNLLVNAAQAMEAQGRITLRTWSDRDNNAIEISDTGCGMSQSVIDKIFDPFFTTKPVGLGTGLGLSISTDIIRRHSGTMTVNSVTGEGTTFCIKLPVLP